MQALNLPTYQFNIRKQDGKLIIFDELRRKNIALTPEEWVRQHLIKYLIEEKNYPPGLISIEAEINVNNLRRRYDGLVFNRERQALVLIECKAPEIKINQKVFDQIFAYNTQVIAPYLLVSNGLQHYILEIRNNKPKFLQEIPVFNELVLTAK